MRRRIVPCLLKRGGSIITLTRAKAKGATTCNLPVLRGISTAHGRARTLVLDPAHRLYLRVTSSLRGCSGFLPNIHILPICNKTGVRPRVHALGGNIRIVITAPNHLVSLVRHNTTSLTRIRGIILSRTSRVLSVKFSRDVSAVLTNMPRGRGALLFSTAVDQRVRHVTGGCLHSTGRVIINSHGRNTRAIGRICCVIRTGSGCLTLGHVISCCPGVCTVVFYHAHVRARRITSGLVRSNCGTSTLRNSLSRRRHSLAVRGFHRRQVRFLITASITTHNLSIRSLARIVGCNVPSSVRGCARQDKHANHTNGGKADVYVVRAHRHTGMHRIRGIVNGRFIGNRVPDNGRVYTGRLCGIVSSVRHIRISRRRVRRFLPRICHGLR